MDRITRKELKTDKFALEFGHTVTFFEEHQKEIARYGGIVVAVAVLIAGYTVYQRHRHTARQVDLAKAIAVQEAAGRRSLRQRESELSHAGGQGRSRDEGVRRLGETIRRD